MMCPKYYNRFALAILFKLRNLVKFILNLPEVMCDSVLVIMMKLIAAEANAVSVRWRIIVSYKSKMYSGKGISRSSIFLGLFVCLFVCCNFE